MDTGKLQTAKIFQSGGSQAVIIPKEFRFDESEVFIKKTDEGVLLIPKNAHSEQVWHEWIAKLAAFHVDNPEDNSWLDIDRGGPPQEREGLDEVFP